MNWPVNPDVENTDWRAVCGRPACTVRREGRRKPFLPLSDKKLKTNKRLLQQRVSFNNDMTVGEGCPCCKNNNAGIYYRNRLGEVKVLKKVYKGIIEGNVICLKEKIDLPIGSQALIKLKTMNKEEQRKIKDRQIKLLDKGFYLGKKLYSKREDLYAR